MSETGLELSPKSYDKATLNVLDLEHKQRLHTLNSNGLNLRSHSPVLQCPAAE
jgi:hypothetical protein